jgi:hypothetical protein
VSWGHIVLAVELARLNFLPLSLDRDLESSTSFISERALTKPLLVFVFIFDTTITANGFESDVVSDR